MLCWSIYKTRLSGGWFSSVARQVPNTCSSISALNGVKNEGNKAIPWVPKGVDIKNNNNKITKKRGKYLEGFSECAVKVQRQSRNFN